MPKTLLHSRIFPARLYFERSANTVIEKSELLNIKIICRLLGVIKIECLVQCTTTKRVHAHDWRRAFGRGFIAIPADTVTVYESLYAVYALLAKCAKNKTMNGKHVY